MTRFKVVVIPADLKKACYIKQLSSLDEMKEIVGGWIEPVRVDFGRLANPSLGAGVDARRAATVYCNEEYRLLNLPFNPRASLLYPWNDGLGGDVFVCGYPDDEGNDTDVPAEVLLYYID